VAHTGANHNDSLHLVTPASAEQDKLLLAQLNRGHWAAMEALVHRYQDRLYSTVFRIVNHQDDAADLVQETFVKAMQNLAKFEGKSSLYTWLFRIAVNLSLSHRRSRQYRDATTLDAGEDDGQRLNQQAAGLRLQLAQTTEQDPADAAALHIDHQHVLAALTTIEPEHRAMIILRDIEDCDYEQIAEIIQIPIGTVKSRLFRARAALREALSRDKAPTG
jgi:RNA polymerase sigma-70 factor (ECF subfamily)